MMAERLAAIDIAEMNLYSGNVYGSDRVSNGHAGVRVGTRINQDALMLPPRSLNSVNESTFVIGLKSRERHLQLFCFLMQHLIDAV